jgi:hypothetical protein
MRRLPITEAANDAPSSTKLRKSAGGAAGERLARVTPDAATSDGFLPGSELQSFCGPLTFGCLPPCGHPLMSGCLRRNIDETECREPACRQRRLMAAIQILP